MVISPFAFGLLLAAKIPIGYSDLILPINYYFKKMNHNFCEVFVNFLNYSENYIILAERAIVFIAHFHVKYAAFMLHYINI